MSAEDGNDDDSLCFWADIWSDSVMVKGHEVCLNRFCSGSFIEVSVSCLFTPTLNYRKLDSADLAAVRDVF